MRAGSVRPLSSVGHSSRRGASCRPDSFLFLSFLFSFGFVGLFCADLPFLPRLVAKRVAPAVIFFFFGGKGLQAARSPSSGAALGGNSGLAAAADSSALSKLPSASWISACQKDGAKAKPSGSQSGAAARGTEAAHPSTNSFNETHDSATRGRGREEQGGGGVALSGYPALRMVGAARLFCLEARKKTTRPFFVFSLGKRARSVDALSCRICFAPALKNQKKSCFGDV